MTKENRSWGEGAGCELPNEKVEDARHLGYMCQSRILVPLGVLNRTKYH